MWDQAGGFKWDQHGVVTKEWRWLTGLTQIEKVDIQVRPRTHFSVGGGDLVGLQEGVSPAGVRADLCEAPQWHFSQDLLPLEKTPGRPPPSCGVQSSPAGDQSELKIRRWMLRKQATLVICPPLSLPLCCSAQRSVLLRCCSRPDAEAKIHQCGAKAQEGSCLEKTPLNTATKPASLGA